MSRTSPPPPPDVDALAQEYLMPINSLTPLVDVGERLHAYACALDGADGMTLALARSRATRSLEGVVPAPVDIVAAAFRAVRPRHPESSVADYWPEPTTLPELPPVPQWNDRLLPESLRPWLADVVERTQCSPEYAAVPAMVALGSVIGRGCAIRPKQRDDWTVTPNLWGNLIGPPSAMKSPALSEALRPLRELAAAGSTQHEELASRREALDARLEATKRALRTAAARGEDTLALEVQYEDARQLVAASATERRYIVHDTTAEKLGEIMRGSPRGVLLVRDELTGWLASLERPGHECDRALYLECWNGTGDFVFDRIGRGTVRIEAACVSIVGGIQPGPLARYMTAAMSGGAGADGFMQRMQLMVYPDVASRWRLVDRWPDTAARQRASEVYRRLAEITPDDVGADASEGIPFVHFDCEGQALYDVWLSELMTRARSGEEHEAMESHLVKYASLVPSLALICQLADCGRGPVGIDATRRAIAWCELLEAHARRVYASATSGEHSSARTLFAKISSGKLPTPFVARDVYRAQWSGLAESDVVESAISTLENYGWLRRVEVQTAGRPRIEVHVHPSLAAAPAAPQLTEPTKAAARIGREQPGLGEPH